MAGKGIQDLVGQVMIDKEFLADLVSDPARVLAGFELSADERAAIMHALGSTATGLRPRAGAGPAERHAQALGHLMRALAGRR